MGSEAVGEDFCALEAELIKNILVSEGWTEDLLIWPLTRFVLLRIFTPGLEEHWKIRTPNKIRHFIWWAVRDSLPTKQNLKARHLPVEETCELRGDCQESFMHSI